MRNYLNCVARKVAEVFTGIVSVEDYLVARIREPASWTAVAAAGTAAAVVAAPWSYLVFFCGVMVVILPTPSSSK